MHIGIISDTHNFFDPKIPKLFSGVEHILHAGDIGLPWIIMELENIAPVTAVLGNTDDPGLQFKQTEMVELPGRKFLVHHIVDPRKPADPIKARIARERPACAETKVACHAAALPRSLFTSERWMLCSSSTCASAAHDRAAPYIW